MLATGDKDVEQEDIPHTTLERGQLKKFRALIKAGDAIAFYEYSLNLTEGQKVELFSQIDTKEKEATRALTKEARELLKTGEFKE